MARLFGGLFYFRVMQMVYYGLAKAEHLRDYAQAVWDVWGHEENLSAVDMLERTALVETHGGRYRDPTARSAGRGLCQIDLIAFEDVQRRTRSRDAFLVLDRLGIDIHAVSHCELDYSPMLSMVFCRLFYKLIPEVFPPDLVGQAGYWKRHYNTEAGKGTVQHFIETVNLYTH